MVPEGIIAGIEVGAVAVVPLNSLVAPGIVGIGADLGAGRTVNAYNVAEVLGGSPTDEPSGFKRSRIL